MSKIDKKSVRRKEQRPGEILAAAERVFARKGYANATMAEIGREAGAAKGTAYLYFAGKQEIFEAMVRELIVPAKEGAMKLLQEMPGSAWDQLVFIVMRPYAEMVDVDSRRSILRILITEGERFPELSAYYYKHSISEVLEILVSIVGRGIASGEFRATLTPEHIRPMIAPAVMAAVWRMAFEKASPLDLEKFSTAHLDLLRHSVLANP
jgi:AcrR family transcriptional regulator